MIITITLNPCIDRSMEIESFQYGGLNRVTHTRQDISGKGINVAKAVKQLGMNVKCFGFNYQENRTLLEEELHTAAIPFDLVNVPGRIRTNVKVFEKKSGVMTEFNENGGCVEEKAVADFLRSIEGVEADLFVLSGSVPPGAGCDIYKRIIQSIPGKKVILDADGEYLRLGVEANPTVIKPNLFELENTYGVKLKNRDEIVGLCRKIIADGVEVICVSMGKDGAVLVDEKAAYYAPALSIDVKGVQGAGDSLVAGMCKAMHEKLSTADILRYAAAAAGASLIREGTLMCTAEGFQTMLRCVDIQEI